MPNPGDFDPARAVNFDLAKTLQDTSQQRAADQRARAERDLLRANVLKLLRYAEEQLEDIPNPVVSEFEIEPGPNHVERFFEIRPHLRPQVRYYGSWLALWMTRGRHYSGPDKKYGLVKLRQPPGGYAYLVSSSGWDPRHGGSVSPYGPSFETFASLEEASGGAPLGNIEGLTEAVRRALYFVATGQPRGWKWDSSKEPYDY